jgi:membrane protease YdiL (CAAX protease family)
MERFSKFCRSLIPADAFQALFLLGVVLISFSRQLGWYSRELVFQYTDDRQVLQRFGIFMVYAILPTVFAGCAGYFICFWPGRHPVRRIVLAVLLPVLAGLAWVFFLYASLAAAPVSVLYRNQWNFFGATAIAKDWRLFPTPFYACLLGAILVLLFLQRLARGKSVLPLSFPVSPGESELGPELSKRISILIFVIPGLVFFTACASTVMALWFVPNLQSPRLDTIFSLSPGIQSLILLLVAILIVGFDGLKSIWKVLQLPPPSFVGRVCLIGVVLGFFVPAVQYLYERSHWAAYDFGRISPPHFSDHITSHAPGALIIGLIVAAICEEMVMRGLLQPGLLARFGMHRGIVFTAAIWGAYEFHLHSFVRYSIPELLLVVTTFFGTHVVLSYLYAWAYLKSGSIIPTIVLHAILSLSFLVRVELDFPFASYARVMVWAIGAMLLYRFWPVRRQMVPPVGLSEANPNPAI